MCHDEEPEVARDQAIGEEALAGLLRQPKTLPPKLFYDEIGCRLFGRISQLPEYYLTRTERLLLEEEGQDIILALDSDEPFVLVEYGASSEAKASLLMRGIAAAGIRVAGYVPIDVAGHALEALRNRMAHSHPDLAVVTVLGDFDDEIALPEVWSGTSKLGFFPGSTIGNFAPEAARSFLARCRRALGRDSHLLIGFDLHKSKTVLVPAYDDSEGVTAAFNLNLLSRLNRECSADFILDRFAHRAVWNDAESRIEMHLESIVEQTVHVAGVVIRFRAGETIHTENSYKYTTSQFCQMAVAAGWVVRKEWVDQDRLFALNLLKAS